MIWGSGAINHIGTSPAFVPAKVGPGSHHNNRCPSPDTRFVAKVSVHFPAKLTVSAASGSMLVDCIVDTGSEHCLFTPTVAHQLGYAPRRDTAITLTRTDGTYININVMLEKISMQLGGRRLAIPVYFPVERISQNHGIYNDTWDTRVTNNNIIGMGGLLGERMLCFTPEELFVLDRK